MKPRNILLGALLAAAIISPAAAQSHLRIGLAEDPDNLDPTTAGSYVGRIVLAAMCDKLFDIDAKLNIVPQLALAHETSEDGKTVTIKLRPGVKFHDGEPFDAEAAKFTLDRHMTMQGSFRRAELAQIDKVEVDDPLTIRPTSDPAVVGSRLSGSSARPMRRWLCAAAEDVTAAASKAPSRMLRILTVISPRFNGPVRRPQRRYPPRSRRGRACHAGWPATA